MSPVPWVSDKRWRTLTLICRTADAEANADASTMPPKWTAGPPDPQSTKENA